MSWIPSPEDIEKMADGIRRLTAAADQVRSGVERYLDRSNDYAGELFNEIGDDGCTDSITETDLLAVSLLDMSIPPRAVRNLIHEPASRQRIQALLGKVPVEIPLWEAEDVHLDACLDLWGLVRGIRGMGRTRTSKLLARKRPHLMPIGTTSWTLGSSVLETSGARFARCSKTSRCEIRSKSSGQIPRPPPSPHFVSSTLPCGCTGGSSIWAPTLRHITLLPHPCHP